MIFFFNENKMIFFYMMEGNCSNVIYVKHEKIKSKMGDDCPNVNDVKEIEYLYANNIIHHCLIVWNVCMYFVGDVNCYLSIKVYLLQIIYHPSNHEMHDLIDGNV